MRFKALWDLMRLEHGLMIAIAILIGSLISLNGENLPALDKFLLTFLTALFLEGSTFALNDYFDLEIDKKNKRMDRPLVRGDLPPEIALYVFLIFFPLGIICSYLVNIFCFMIAVITGFLAVLYDFKLKKMKILGNFYIAYAMAVPFVFGGAAVASENISFFEINPAIYVVALIAFLTGSGREIMKDAMDLKGDREKGVKSIPMYMGVHRSNVLSSFFYLGAVALSFLPFLIKKYDFYYLNYNYLAIVSLTDAILVFISANLIFKKKPALKKYRLLTLIAVFIGLIAFLIPILIKIT